MDINMDININIINGFMDINMDIKESNHLSEAASAH